MPATAKPLGEWLVESGHLTLAAVNETLDEQRLLGGRFGDRLILSGRVNAPMLAKGLANQAGMRSINLWSAPPDPGLSDARHLSHYLKHRMIPWREEGGVLHLAAAEPCPRMSEFVARHYGAQARIVLATPREVKESIERDFCDGLSEHACLALWQRLPELSARRRKGDLARLGAMIGLVVMAALSPLLPALHGTVLLAANLFFLGSLALRAFLLARGESPPALPEVQVAEWPVYTVLVPLFRETRVIATLFAALEALDYPKDKLDVKLVLEADDLPTWNAAMAASPPPYIEILRVPPSQPRTKPKACNYALRFARGEFVTIYDAEDRPDPLQLKKAVRAFRALPGDIACLQARLSYYNRRENLLTRLFAIEYALLFDRLIPGLARSGIPIPLGGTSNHLRLSALRWVGEWDPFNVTEDADLGLRLAAAGYRTLLLDSETLEEAPITLGSWIKQRSRWIKGYFITWTVHGRDPKRIRRHVGRRAYWSLQFFIGGASLVYLLAPVLWGHALAWGLPGVRLPGLSPILQALCLGTLLCGFGLQWWSAARIVRARGWKGMELAILLFPLYWFLHSVAAVKAFWQLVSAPYHWEKTEHGVSRFEEIAP